MSSLIGGNGDLGFQLWSPSNSALQLDISSKSLWDDRTPDLQTPSSFGPKKKFYVGNFVDDQPRLPSSGHFEISWPSSGKVPVLASGRMSLYNARAILNITTTTAGGGFSIAVWASADHSPTFNFSSLHPLLDQVVVSTIFLVHGTSKVLHGLIYIGT